MVDLIKRNKLAEALRHLATGQISNDEFESRLMWIKSYFCGLEK
jgi:hypothetical protein